MRLRLTSGLITSKYGFSVVAPIRITVPASTHGSSASCCALFQRCTSSTNRMVRRPYRSACWPASLIASRRSLTPASTALMAMKCARVVLAMTRARVVLPVPGGP